MTDQEARYDRIADGYARWWAPVHRSASLRLLDDVDAAIAAGARRILDVGCGTGALAAAAVTRWPGVTVDGVDASAGMLRVAERERTALPEAAARRVALAHGHADRLPFADGTFDLVLSSFVLQLVPSRARALREMRRVLRPGGRIAYVTWLPGGEAMAADDAFDEALVAVGLEPRGHDPDDGSDPATPDAAALQLRRAGFGSVRARAETLRHQFGPESFVAFLAQFDEEDRFATLDPGLRGRLERELLGRLRALPPDGLRLVLPIVYAAGVRTARR